MRTIDWIFLLALIVLLAFSGTSGERLRNAGRKIPETKAEPKPDTSNIIEVGDLVQFVFTDTPNELRTVTITDDKSDPANGFITKRSPLGYWLLGLQKDQEAIVGLPTGGRSVLIREIKKASLYSL